MPPLPQSAPLTASERDHLRNLAHQAAANSYSPYSRFRVGAALLLEDGSIVTGCNVENASYRLTSCAEQGAIARAVAQHGPAIRLRAVAVANLNHAASILILYPGENGAFEETTLGDLLPHAFRLEFLTK
jgi:cytidine deaminase